MIVTTLSGVILMKAVALKRWQRTAGNGRGPLREQIRDRLEIAGEHQAAAREGASRGGRNDD